MAQRLDAVVVDRDDQDVGIGVAPTQRQGAVIKDLIEAPQAVERAQDGGKHRQNHRQPQP
ncbi:hypothetical protein D3C78_1835210 [compost metagenome]